MSSDTINILMPLAIVGGGTMLFASILWFFMWRDGVMFDGQLDNTYPRQASRNTRVGYAHALYLKGIEKDKRKEKQKEVDRAITKARIEKNAQLIKDKGL